MTDHDLFKKLTWVLLLKLLVLGALWLMFVRDARVPVTDSLQVQRMLPSASERVKGTDDDL